MKKEKKVTKKLMRTGAAVMSAAMMVAPMATAVTPAYAANSALKGATVKGGTADFDKYLVLRKNANVPNATFSFSITGSTARTTEDTNSTNLTVKKGIGTPTVSNVTFAPGDTTYDSLQSGRTTSASTGANAVAHNADQVDVNPSTPAIDAMASNQAYAKKSATVNFSNITYSEPGIYRYKITENGGSEKGVTYDTTPRYMDVYVDTTSEGGLEILGYVMHRNDEAQPKGTSGTGENNPAYKNEGMTNVYTTYDFDITKTVTGNAGFLDQYFKYHVKVSNLDQGWRGFLTTNDGNENTYNTSETVPYSYNQDTGGRNNTQKRFVASTGTTLSDVAAGGTKHHGLAVTDTDNNGTVEFDVYLKHGDSLRVNGATSGAKYSIVEEYQDYNVSATQRTMTEGANNGAPTANGYGTATALPLTKTTGSNSGTAEQTLTANVTNDFVNDRRGVLPTGWYHNAKPWSTIAVVGIIGALLASAGAFVLKAKGYIFRKKEEESKA